MIDEELQRLVEPATLGDPERPLQWRLRHRRQRRLRQPRHHLRHRRVRRGGDPPLAGALRRRALPQGQGADDHGHCGGSNGARVRLWKVELQKLADATRLMLHVHHYPPGTSKWNRVEHRLFCHITQNWRGRPLTDRLAVVELIGATTTKAGLKAD
jgi:hypothetical protein